MLSKVILQQHVMGFCVSSIAKVQDSSFNRRYLEKAGFSVLMTSNLSPGESPTPRLTRTQKDLIGGSLGGIAQVLVGHVCDPSPSPAS